MKTRTLFCASLATFRRRKSRTRRGQAEMAGPFRSARKPQRGAEVWLLVLGLAGYAPLGAANVFAPMLDLSELDGSNGFVLNGIDRSDRAGCSVSGAGDINGDGIDDLIVGAYFADPNGVSNAGESYVVFGTDQGFAAVLELSALDGSNGFVMNGIDPVDNSGRSASGAGDVNGDGIDDLIVGASRAGSGASAVGESYVVFGSNQAFAAALELATLDGSSGFVLNGIDADDASGHSVSGAGDVNGDGIDDLIVGTRRAVPGDTAAGESYVVFGSDQGFAAALEFSALDGSNGFVLKGIDAGDLSGTSVSGAGDVNGDGIDDLIVGAVGADPNSASFAGESYVVFGTDQGFAAALELSALDGSNGFVLKGIDAGDSSGNSVSGAGDVNGDGVDDLIVGAVGADPNGASNAGESYVVFGTNQGFAATLELAALDGSNGFVAVGIDADDSSGRSVSGAGDVNGDGFDDVIVGADYGDPNGVNSGESYVVLGTDQGFAAALDLSALDGSNGFVLNGIDAGDVSGISVSGAGDVNGDGIDDLIVGAYFADPNGDSEAGESYVIFGRPGDRDEDGVLNNEDNCLARSNAEQRDTDGDNIGNACDADIAPMPNDCLVNFADLNAMKTAFFSTPAAGTWNPDADLDGDGIVNFLDLERMKESFFGPPGPSGEPNDCQ